MWAVQPRGPLGVAWRCWLMLLVVAYTVLIITFSSVAAAALWQGSGIARPAASVLLCLYGLESRVVWRWAGRATWMTPPTPPGRYVLLALV